jgi:hypothetical protein
LKSEHPVVKPHRMNGKTLHLKASLFKAGMKKAYKVVFLY